MPFESSPLRPGDETEEGDALCHRPRVCARMHGQAQAGQALDHGRAPGPQRRFVRAKEQQVVHVAHVAWTAQAPRDEMIQRIEIDIGPKLAGQVADGQTAWALRCERVIAREIDHVVGLLQDARAAGQDAADQPAQAGVGHFGGQEIRQDGVVNAGKNCCTSNCSTYGKRRTNCCVRCSAQAQGAKP